MSHRGQTVANVYTYCTCTCTVHVPWCHPAMLFSWVHTRTQVHVRLEEFQVSTDGEKEGGKRKSREEEDTCTCTVRTCIYDCTYMYMYTYANMYMYMYCKLCVCEDLRPAICVACAWRVIRTHTPGHPSAADEAWYWLKCVLHIGWLSSRPKGRL